MVKPAALRLALPLALAVIAVTWTALYVGGRDPAGTDAPGPARMPPEPVPSATARSAGDPPALVGPAPGSVREPAAAELETAAAAPPLAEDAARERSTPAEARLTVRVSHPDGRPVAGIPVALRSLQPNADAPLTIDHARTGPDGLARYERELDPVTLEAAGVLSVAIDLELEPGVERTFTPVELAAALAGAPVDLTLPEGAEALAGPLRVRVLDAVGLPAAGVSVAYQLVTADSDQDLASARTGADGIAALDREKEGRLRAYFEGMRLPYVRRVACQGPLRSPPSAELELGDLARVVELRLEPTVALAVSVVGPDGAPISEGAAVQLSWTRPGEERRDGFEWLELADGRALVEHVGCGLELSLGASVRGSRFKGVYRDLVAPASHGEVVAVELRFGDEHPVLAGRLVDPAGQPLAELTFWLEHDYSGPSPDGRFRSGGRRLETDAEGRFELPWTMATWEQAARDGHRILRLTEDAQTASARSGAPRRYAEIAAPGFVAGKERYELGEVALHPMPLLAAGRVFGPDGQPLGSANVQLQYAAGDSWYNHDERLRTGDDGRFECYSQRPYERLRVHAWKARGGSSEAVECYPGAGDLRLAIARESLPEALGTVRGRVLADPEIPWPALTLRLRRKDPDQAGHRSGVVFAGGFRVTRVTPGAYVVELRGGGHGYSGPDFVFATEPVEVHADVDTAVPDIDLRGALRVFELNVEDLAGKPLHRVSYSVASGGEDLGGGWVRDGRLAFVAPAELDTVVLLVGDHEPFSASWSSAPQTVRVR